MSAPIPSSWPTDLEHYLSVATFNNLAKHGITLQQSCEATKKTLEWMRQYHPALLPVSENEPHNSNARN